MSQVRSKDRRHETQTTAERGDDVMPEFKYIQYLPKDMEANRNVNIDKAIRSLYAPPHKDIMQLAKPKSPTKHGGFEAVFLKRKEDFEKEQQEKEG